MIDMLLALYLGGAGMCAFLIAALVLSDRDYWEEYEVTGVVLIAIGTIVLWPMFIKDVALDLRDRLRSVR